MRRGISVLFVTLIFLYTCTRENDEGSEEEEGAVFTAEQDSFQANYSTSTYLWEKYTNEKFHFRIEHPEGWQVAEGAENIDVPIINIYSTEFDNTFVLPLTIHGDPRISHVSFYPEGLPTDIPSGQAVTLAEAESHPSVSFELDSTRSMAYQLNNGKVWGYFLKPKNPPPRWTDDGFIFAQVQVQDYELKCFDNSGKEKPMGQCDPINGKDRVIRYGNVHEKDKQIIRQMLNLLKFTSSRPRSLAAAPPDKENINASTNMIQVEEPSPGDTVRSPVVIKGKARGSWFFEGQFPVKLKSSNSETLAEATATAEGEWMTSDWVPFRVEIPVSNIVVRQEAFIILKRSNASGKPEHDRFYTIPVVITGQ